MICLVHAWACASSRHVLSEQWSPATLSFGGQEDRVILVAGNTGYVSLWDAAEPRRLREWVVQGKAVGLDREAKSFATAFFDAGRLEIQVWDTSSDQSMRSIKGPEDFDAAGTRIGSIAFFPGSDHLIFGGSDGYVRVWNLRQGNQVQKLEHAGPITSVAVSPDGMSIAAACYPCKGSKAENSEVRVWNVFQPDRMVKLVAPGILFGSQSVVFAADSKSVFYPAGRDGVVWMVDINSGKVMRQIWNSFADSAVALATSPDGRFLFAGTAKGILEQWSIPDGALVHIFHAHSRSLETISVSPDGRWLATGGIDRQVKIWSLNPSDRSIFPAIRFY